MKNIHRLLLTLVVSVSATTFAANNVITVNGVGIPQSTFDMEKQRAIKSGAKDTPQLHEAIKRQMIANELIYQEAQKQKLDKAPEVLRAVDNVKRQAMVDLYIAKSVKPQPITEAAVKEEYEQFKGRLGAQEYRIRIIQTASEANAQAALKHIKNGQDFAAVAQKTSVNPSAQQGGEINWFSFKTPAEEGKTNNLPLPIAQAIEKMRSGEVSHIINTHGAWWIVKLDKVRPTKVPPFEEVKTEIRNALTARAIDTALNAKLEALYKQAKIQ
jgi:parvulin-like peptidyl-prolyl isomerase